MSKKTPFLSHAHDEMKPQKAHFKCDGYSCVQNLQTDAKNILKDVRFTDKHLKLHSFVVLSNHRSQDGK